MNTKLVDKIYVEKNDIVDPLLKDWRDFLEGKPIVNETINNVYQKVCSLLVKRWVPMQDDLIYDNEIVACYKNPNKIPPITIENVSIEESLSILKSNFGTEYKFDFFTGNEIYKALFKVGTIFSKDSYYRPFFNNNSHCEFIKGVIGNNVYSFKMNSGEFYSSNGAIFIYNESGAIIPLVRLYKKDSDILDARKVMFLWILNGMIPVGLENDDEYLSFFYLDYEVENFFHIKNIILDVNYTIDIVDDILYEDKIRADIKEYNQRMLEDTEQGHWSLWNFNSEVFENPLEIELGEKYVARNPASSIVDGVVGIDFGTKSTVVVYQENNVKTHPMRIGTGDLSTEIKSYHYENPTIMEFNNLEKFIAEYNSRNGRPFTEWKDLTISHTAFHSMMESSTDNFNSYTSDLKQWAGNKNRKLKIVDKNSYIVDLPSFIDLKEGEINPIELYAYYLGLYINNQHNGIFMNYILSFPVTYELEIRNKIIDSFYKGIKKSLPQELHNQTEYLEKLNIIKGASEPAAYAVIALQEYGFEPENDEKIFYGIFDFGGGTTDFDFGIWRESQGGKEKRYDYVIEHFGAGGDRYLGGENLLELLAFEVFKKNKENLLAEQIQFILPPECDKFLGSETLLSQSREAKMNTKTLMEVLRPFWEQHEGYLELFENGEIRVNLSNVDGKVLANHSLDINVEELNEILRNRIYKGIKNFFESLRIAFSNQEVNLGDIDKINIFLAGNSSKANIVKEIFEEEIQRVTEDMKKSISIKTDGIFEVFPSLGTEDANKKLEERNIRVSHSLGKPTGKTGVAFGLIETRKGGDILVIDHNLKEENINFKYYLGESRKKKFKVIIDRDEDYNKWIEFIDASEDTFEIYYTSQPIASTNNLEISDVSIKKIIVKIDEVNDDYFVYIRLVNSNEIEYVVSTEEMIKNNQYIGKVEKINLD